LEVCIWYGETRIMVNEVRRADLIPDLKIMSVGLFIEVVKNPTLRA
jgi:hypothetical protein